MDHESYVKLAAEVVGLPIPDEYLAGTVLNFERSVVLARQVTDFPLPADVEAAPVFEP